MRGLYVLPLLSVVASACAAHPPIQATVDTTPTSVARASTIPAAPGTAPATSTWEAAPGGAILAVSEAVLVRSGPGTDWEPMGELSPGNEYPVRARSGDWLQVQFGDRAGWVYAALTHLSGDLEAIPITPETPLGVTATGAPSQDDQRAAIESIREFMHEPDLVVAFVGTTTMVNSPNADVPVAAYRDDLGTEYMLETGQGRLVEIDPSSSLVPSLPQGPALTLPELRAEALRIASESMPGFAGMQRRLDYQEGTKDGRVYFFRWDDRDAVGWRFNRPFAQVGLHLTGHIVSYFNTLILE